MNAAEVVFGRRFPPGAVSCCLGGAATVFLPLPRDGWWECHCHASPCIRGAGRVTAFRATLRWWWSLGRCTVLLTHIRLENRPARALARWIGMRPTGAIAAPCEDGITRDLTVYRIDKP